MKNPLVFVMMVLSLIISFNLFTTAQTVYYVGNGGSWNNWDIYSFNIQDSVETRLTFNSAIDNHPVINHVDTNQIAFSSNRDGEEFDIYIADVSDIDGTATRLTFNDNWPDRHPHWHPNGHQIIYSSKDRPVIITKTIASECSQPIITHEIRYYEGLNIIELDSPMTIVPLDINTAWNQSANPGIWIPDDSVYIGHPSFNHQGDKIVFTAAIDGEGKNWEIYTVGYNQITKTLNPGSLNRITNGPNNTGTSNAIKLTGGGTFSYDDNFILFNSTRTSGGNSQLFTVPANGSDISVDNAIRLTWTHGNDYVPEVIGDGRIIITSDLGYPLICPCDTLPGATKDLDVVLLDSTGKRIILGTETDQQTLLIADEVSWFCGEKPNLSKCTFLPRIMSTESLWLQRYANDLIPSDLLEGYDLIYADSAKNFYDDAWWNLNSYLYAVDTTYLNSIRNNTDELWTDFPGFNNDSLLGIWLDSTKFKRNDKWVVPAIMYESGLGEGCGFKGCHIELRLDISHDTTFSNNNGAIDLELMSVYWPLYPPHSFAWSTGDTTEDISGLGFGKYTVTITDSMGCQDSITITIFLIAIDELDKQNMLIYPNPTSGEFLCSFNVTLSEEVNLVVTNMLGENVYEQILPFVSYGQQVKIDLSDLADGSYLITLRNDQINFVQKLIIQK
ncbi:T9SS type A sorting domain-containing protein [candidate division KSB1 bacterium]